jgi:RNA polymerase sigma-70 factor (ECF subfamily)
MFDEGEMGPPDFEKLVSEYYAALYRFAFSLTHSESEACDLVQQTYYLWATKGHQLKDGSKAKSWLFTTLHREFLRRHRRETRFPHEELEESDDRLPLVVADRTASMDAAAVHGALGLVDEVFRAPVALFYLEDQSYQAIAEILEVPLGTVKSRISRGIAQLHRHLTRGEGAGSTQGRGIT